MLRFGLKALRIYDNPPEYVGIFFLWMNNSTEGNLFGGKKILVAMFVLHVYLCAQSVLSVLRVD